jgi:hypothetical protein
MASETVTIIDSAGGSHVLDGSTTANPLCFARSGFNMPPVTQIDQRTPLQPGTKITYTDFLARPILLALNVNGNGNENTLRSQIRTMSSVWFHPAKPFTVRNTATDGVQRDLLNCIYLAGMDGDESYPNRKPGSIVCPVQIEAPDPFWYDTVPTFLTSNTSSGGAFSFLSTQFLPLILQNANTWLNVVITNTGDFETWPVWQLHGPLNTPISVYNLTTGKKIDLSGNGGLNLAGNDALTIDAQAGTITKQDGTSQVGFLTSDSAMWPLALGTNVISINGTNAGTTKGSLLSVRYKQRYNSV